MAIAKKLVLLGCYACAASALLLICIAVPAIVSLVNSGKPICMPGLSIRCHESDCGRFFQRCGSIVLLEVPAYKVCFRGALVSARRTDLHSCPSTTTIASNSTQSRSGLGSCSCSGCTYPNSCKCICQNGSGGSVQCRNPLKEYPSDAVARCCLSGSYSGAGCVALAKPPVWRVVLEAARQQLAELSQWSPKAATSSFTFQPPLSGSGGCPCTFTGTCASLSC